MKLLPLPPVTDNSSSALSITRCATCPKKSMYHLAQKGGWTYDPKGMTFTAYYCDTCTQSHPHTREIAMAKLRIQISAVNDVGKEFHQEMTFDHHQLGATPNPRQALVSHCMYMIREVLSYINPTIKDL